MFRAGDLYASRPRGASAVGNAEKLTLRGPGLGNPDVELGFGKDPTESRNFGVTLRSNFRKMDTGLRHKSLPECWDDNSIIYWAVEKKIRGVKVPC